jgi:hypothetical protein
MNTVTIAGVASTLMFVGGALCAPDVRPVAHLTV